MNTKITYSVCYITHGTLQGKSSWVLYIGNKSCYVAAHSPACTNRHQQCLGDQNM